MSALITTPDSHGYKDTVRALCMNKEENRLFFSQCIDETMNSLYSLALRLTRNPADAEELVAESVAKAWSAFDTLEDRSCFRSWMFRILNNCFISDYRKKSIRPKETTFDESLLPEGEDEIVNLMIQQPNEFMEWWANPEIEFYNQILGETILKAIESLPEAFRMTVMLVNVEGLSYDEAAEILDVPSGTIHSRMKRGRTLLQKALWELAIEEGLIDEKV